MNREYVDRGPYIYRSDNAHGWVVYLDDAGDLKYLCETNAEGKAKDIVGIMNADVARFDAGLATLDAAREEGRREGREEAAKWHDDAAKTLRPTLATIKSHELHDRWESYIECHENAAFQIRALNAPQGQEGGQ